MEHKKSSSLSDELLDQSLDVVLAHPLHAQQLIVHLGKLPTKSLAPEGTLDEAKGPARVGLLALGQFAQLHIGILLERLGGNHLCIPVTVLASAFRQLNQLVLCHDCILNQDGAVLCVGRVGQGANNGLADAGTGGGAERAVTAVVQLGLFVLGTDEETNHQTPVEDGTIENEVVGDLALVGLALEEVLGRHFVAVDWKGLGLGVGGV